MTSSTPILRAPPITPPPICDPKAQSKDLASRQSIMYPQISNPFTPQQSDHQTVQPIESEDLIRRALQKLRFEREPAPQYPISIADPAPVSSVRYPFESPRPSSFPSMPESTLVNFQSDNTTNKLSNQRLNSPLTGDHNWWNSGIRVTGESFWCRKVLKVVISAKFLNKSKLINPDVFFIFNLDGSSTTMTSAIQRNTREPTWNESMDM
jgi:hypothetical protein